MYESIEMSKSEDQKKAERDSGTVCGVVYITYVIPTHAIA